MRTRVRSAFIGFRMTPGDRRRFVAAAKIGGFSITEWILVTLREAAAREIAVVTARTRRLDDDGE